MTVSGDFIVFLIFFCLPAAMIAGAVKGTRIIWESRGQDKPRYESTVTPVVKG